jgi:hypothetical protein
MSSPQRITRSLIALGSALLLGCGGQRRVPSASDWMAGTYELECDRIGQEGQQVVTVWTTAKSVDRALAETRRNAVQGLLLRGLATTRCQVPPLLRPADITPEASRYLSTFFAAGGQYEGYVSSAGDVVLDKVVVRGGVKVAAQVVIARGRLAADLEKARIIRGLSAGLR